MCDFFPTANRPSAKDDENLPMASAPQMSSSDEVDDTKFEVDTKPSAENIKPNLEAVNMVRPAISERVLRPSPSSFTKHFQPYFRQARRKPKTLYEKVRNYFLYGSLLLAALLMHEFDYLAK